MVAKANKTIAVTIRFYTNDLGVSHHGKKSLACWDSGVALIEANKAKGISSAVTQIHCYEDVVPAIKELFRKAKIYVVSPSQRPRIYNHRRKNY